MHIQSIFETSSYCVLILNSLKIFKILIFILIVYNSVFYKFKNFTCLDQLNCAHNSYSDV
jgi:hypothetical protein